MIPNILHFVFGMAPDFGGKPFSLAHYLSLRSAIALNEPDAAIFYYQYEPTGEWWDKAKRHLVLHKVKAPDEFMDRPLYHVAHKADVVRLQALKEHGGIYMDLDTISVKPLSDLLNDSFVLRCFVHLRGKRTGRAFPYLVNDLPGGGASRFDPGSSTGVKDLRKSAETIAGMHAEMGFPGNGYFSVRILFCNFFHD